MQIRLNRKLAEMIDGIDLTHRQVGDVFDLSDRDGQLLILEEWAVGTDGDGALDGQVGLVPGNGAGPQEIRELTRSTPTTKSRKRST